MTHPGLVLVATLLVVLAGGGLASRLSLQTDLAELLPPNAPSVIALKQLNKRVGGTGNVAIALESDDPPSLRAYIPQLVEVLRRQLGPDLLAIKFQKKDVTDYYNRFAAYYVPLADLERWQGQLHEEIGRQENPGLVDLDDGASDKGAPSAPATGGSSAGATDGHDDELQRIIREVHTAKEKAGPTNRADPETGYLMSEGGKLAVIFVRPAANSLNLAGSAGMLSRIQAIAESTHPETKHVRIAGYTGSIPAALAEVKAIQRDIVSTALLVVALVGSVVIAYFRGAGGMFRWNLDGWRELFFLTGAMLVGITVAMGFAELWIGHVNAQTAFLGSIIMGTGINYGIIFLDRYRQLRGQFAADMPGRPQTPSEYRALLERSIDETLRATWIAALATAVSFGVLAAGEVESFHQFGWIGGLGILACWIASFTVVPASVVLFDRRRTPRPLPAIRPLSSLLGGLGRLAFVARVPIVALVLAMSTWAGWLAWQARHDVVETDMSKLGTRSSRSTGIEKLDNRLRVMDDRSSTPAVIATDSREETLAVCDVLNKRAKDMSDCMGKCWSILDALPRDLDKRRPIIGKLRHDLDRVDVSTLNETDKKEFDALIHALDERPPTDEDMPATLKEPFVERDGSVGKLAFVDPHNENIESNLYRFSDAIRSVPLPSGKVITSSGETVVFADVLRAMRRDARNLTFAAAALVLLVLAIVTRRKGTFVRVGGALCLGVVIMCGFAVWFGEKLNFFNFVALPTTFGIGIDYAINVEERLRLRDSGDSTGRRERIALALAEIGPAVALASLTSIFGYASLLTADSRILSSFGRLAMIGEFACVAVALLLVPSLWSLRSSAPPLDA